MTRIILLLAAVIWPAFGNAAPLTVQTGEHETFTRVVVTISEGSEWQLGRQSEGYKLQVATREGFALNGFFDLIPRSRILEVSQVAESGELFLQVACDCNAQASVFQSTFLVVDIVDGAPLEESPFEVAFPDPMASSEEASLEDAVNSPYRPTPDRILPLITPRYFAPPSRDSLAEPRLLDLGEPTPSSEAVQVDDNDQALRTLERSLTESLGRGLTEGLLDQGQSLDTKRGAFQKAADGLDNPNTSAFPGLNTQSSVDPFAVISSSRIPETQAGRACLPSKAFDIAAWGDSAPPYQQLSTARRAFVDDADQVQEEALLRLARLYVFLGFGREAQQVLDLDDAQTRERVIIRAIAQLIDDEAGSLDLFSGQVSCPTNVALWALLAQDKAPVDGQVDRSAVVNTFKELPSFVRLAIAPRLTEALLAIGAEDAAMQILGRDPPDDRTSVDVSLAGAALANALGQEGQAIEIISDVARNAQRTTPEAMTRYFREGIKIPVIFSDEDFLLADALRFENGQSLSETALAEAQFEAYLAVDRFADGRALIDSRRDRLPNLTLREARGALLEQATERMSDGDFLDFIWQEETGDQDATTKNLIAQRLNDLGFPNHAAQWRGMDDEGRTAAEEMVTQTIPGAFEVNIEPETTELAAIPRVDPVGEFLPLPETVAIAEQTEIPSLQNGRALIKSATDSREAIRALLQSNPAPSEY